MRVKGNSLFGKLVIGLAGIFVLFSIVGCEIEKSVTGPTASNTAESSINNAATKKCTDAKLIWSGTQCGSVKSNVGPLNYPCCDNNDNNKATDSNDGNCTWYVEYRAKQKGWNVPSSWGDASNWCTKAEMSGAWNVSNTPKRNTIACSSRLGHVAWVRDVSPDKKTIYVDEMNCRVKTSPSCKGTGERTNWPRNASDFKYISKSTSAVDDRYAKFYDSSQKI